MSSILKWRRARSVICLVTTRRRLRACCLGVVAVITALALLPGLGGAAEDTGRSPTCRPDFARDPAGTQVGATPDAGPGATDTLTIEVPEGRLYLAPDRVGVAAMDGRGRQLAPVLLADLREQLPGWQLSATLVALRVDGSPAEGTLRIEPGEVEPIIGERGGIVRHRGTTIGVGQCVALLTASPGAGWGSFRETAVIQADLADAAPGADVEVVLQLHIH